MMAAIGNYCVMKCHRAMGLFSLYQFAFHVC